MNARKIAIGSDHAGFYYKAAIIKHLEAAGYQVIDKGTYSEAAVDYPDFAHPVAAAVESGQADSGILICGSGNGVAITANKHQGIRAALCWTVELAALARRHNDANIISLPARFVSLEDAIAMVDTFLNTAFEGGRHQNRINKIAC
ncbi:ribose 5-phosphate isomerase B [Rhodoflexus sp.]